VGVSETHLFLEGREITILQRVRTTEEGRKVVIREQIRGPKGEHEFVGGSRSFLISGEQTSPFGVRMTTSSPAPTVTSSVTKS